MTRIASVPLLIVTSAVLALAGCGQSSNPEPAASSSTAPARAAPTTATKTTIETPPGDEHIRSKRYRIDITYPRLPTADAVLAKALRETSAKAKHEFKKSLPGPKQRPEFANRQFQLMLAYSVAARMPAFVSVRERGMADTGGAHPIPVDASFVYATKVGKLITLDDLFSDPAKARERLSQIARKSLDKTLLAKVPGGARTPAKARAQWMANMRKMINEGTQPTALNFSEFVVLAGAGDKASGLELIFSPYQVAPYVYGSQSVEVPVDAFADLLKPAYRNDFDLP